MKKVSIVHLKEYMELKLNGKLTSSVYFYRQKIYKETGKMVPDQKHGCVCRKIINPEEDDVFICKSSKCATLFHKQSIAIAPVKKCPTCQSDIPFVLFASPNKSTVINHPNPMKSSSQSQDIEMKEQAKKNPSKTSPKALKKYEVHSKAIPEDDREFPTLSSQLSKTLVLRYKEWKEANAGYAKKKNLHGASKSRMMSRVNLSYNLFLGVYEIKESGQEVTNELIGKKINQNFGDEEACEFTNLLAKALETTVWEKFGQTQSIHYVDKIRLLIGNLKSKTNPDLRRKVISEEISLKTLVGLTAEELLPSAVRAQKKKNEEKRIKETMVISDKIVIISKNHKGEQVFNPGQDDDYQDIREEILDNKPMNVQIRDEMPVDSQGATQSSTDYEVRTESNSLNFKMEPYDQVLFNSLENSQLGVLHYFARSQVKHYIDNPLLQSRCIDLLGEA